MEAKPGRTPVPPLCLLLSCIGILTSHQLLSSNCGLGAMPNFISHLLLVVFKLFSPGQGAVRAGVAWGQDALACYLCFSGSVSCGEGTHMLEQHRPGFTYKRGLLLLCALCLVISLSGPRVPYL